MDAGTDGGPEPEFAVELHAAAATQPLYSISFDEQGPFLYTTFVVSPDQTTCPGVTSIPSDTWLLELWVPLANGTYPVGPSNSDDYPPSSGQTVAFLRHTPAGTFSAVEILPVTGQVIISSAPANEAAQTAGAHVKGSFHLGFPADPIQPPKCVGGGEVLPDGGMAAAFSSCTCDDVNGNQVSICDGGGPSCCLSTATATFFADATFDALPCFYLCIAPSGEFDQCLPIFPDGGVD